MVLNLSDDQKEKLGIIDKRVDFYFKVENAVVDNKVFSNIYESYLFVVLSRFCNNGNVAFPSYNTLAELCYCSRRKIIDTMASLEKKGLINKVKRIKEREDLSTNLNDTNVYTVNNIKIYLEKDREKTLVITTEKEGGAGYALGKKTEKELNKNLGSAGYAPPLVQDMHYPSAGYAPNKEQDIKNKIIKNHDTEFEKHDFDFFENLFKKYKIPFHKKNQKSVFNLLVKMKRSEIENYLNETFEDLSSNKSIKNIPALFTSKINKQERQINKKIEEKIEEIISTDVIQKKEIIKDTVSEEEIEKMYNFIITNNLADKKFLESMKINKKLYENTIITLHNNSKP